MKLYNETGGPRVYQLFHLINISFTRVSKIHHRFALDEAVLSNDDHDGRI